MDWAAAHGINLRFKAPRQQAWIVERHNETLRRMIHWTEAQIKSEGIWILFEQIVAICTFVHKSMVVIDGSTPYKGAFGRQPVVLPPLVGGHLGKIDSQARFETNARFEA